MKRHLCWLFSFSILLGSSAVPTEGRTQNVSKPDIVVFMLDDLAVTVLEAALHFERTTGVKVLENFRKYILPTSTQFTESFTSNPVCCPSRATYLTGQYSHNNKVFTNKVTNGTLLFLNETATIATALQAAGYHTAHIGKYVNGYGKFISHNTTQDLTAARILNRTNVNIGNRSAKLEPSYRPPGWTDWYTALDPTTYCTTNFFLNENGALRNYLKTGEVREIASIDALAAANGNVYNASTLLPASYGEPGNYQTKIFARRAVDAILHRETANPSAPLFLTVMPLAPHIEECDLSNSRYVGTPAEDRGPIIKYERYPELFEASIRPAEHHQSLIQQILPYSHLYLENAPPSFTSPKLSFNEADTSDKPSDIRAKMPSPMTPVEVENMKLLLASQMASLASVDELIGSVLGMLELLGRLQNTVVIFTSDNGYAFGEHRLTSKLTAYEEVAKVPLYVGFPGNSRKTSSRLVLNNDLAPTIAELAGATLSIQPDGRSLLPLLANPNEPVWRRQILLEHFTTSWEDEPLFVLEKKSLWALRTDGRGPFRFSKLTEHFEGMQFQTGYFVQKPPLDLFGFPTIPPLSGMQWMGVKYFDELYELGTDRFEIDNLLYSLGSQSAQEQARRLDVQSKLKACLDRLKGCRGLACRSFEDEVL